MGGFRVLILGGTAEARELSRILDEDGNYDVFVSLKGLTDRPQSYAGTLVTGGFGGEAGLRDYLTQTGIDACVNATHPFADTMSRNARNASLALSIPFLRLRRPQWPRQAGDEWLEVDTIEQAIAAIGPGETVFLALGSKGSKAFADVRDARFLIRTADPVARERQWSNADYITGLPNRDVESEAELLKSRHISCLVARNSGGKHGYSKIAAARCSGVRVIMIRPPIDAPPGSAQDPETAYKWLEFERMA